MPAQRDVPLRRPITIHLDGEALPADDGEPLAQALVAADKLTLARSPKLHRPRGPWCLRGGCDGCLMRVDGVPNVMTCLTPAHDGARIETQNVLGSRTTDLLRVTDWFFPDGIDHHHLMAGVPGLSAVMQSFARRVAGLGTLPDRPAPPAQGSQREVDALVVGAGPAGLAAAAALGQRGRSVVLVDDGLSPGGSARALGDEALVWLDRAHPLGQAEVRRQHVAAGVYGGSCLIVGPDRAELLRPRTLILATGAHDGMLAFENNDLPGVFAARAAAQLAAAGVLVGERVVIAGQGPFGAALARWLQGKAEVEQVEAAAVVKAEGASRVGGVLVEEGGKRRRVRCDALVIDAPPAPAFELIGQAGGEALWDHDRGFFPRCDAQGRVAPGVWVAGEARGVAFDLRRLTDDGRAVAQAACA